MRERLRQAPAAYDVVVVGGGINGAGVARDAALRGLRVGLVEQDDFASGTSSRSSKLVHGGVRYLEQRALRLVWQACQERRRLLTLAPHLVRPLSFVFPVYRDSRFGPLQLRAGMWLYDLLAAFRNVHRHRMLSTRETTGRDGLRSDGLRGAALYWDAAMDDARLVVANARAARAAGATVLGRVECTGLVTEGGRVAGVALRDRDTDVVTAWGARAVVTCTGPWTNAFLAAVPGAPRPLATTRGTHLVLPRLSERALTLAAGRDGRVFFVLPWLGLTLVGTTDVDDAGAPEAAAPTEEEIEYLLAETNRFFPAARLGRRDVVAAFAGLRPLLATGGAASTRSREHAVLEPVPGLVVVAGGKYTTYRAVAEEVVDGLAHRLGRRGRCRTAALPLPGGDVPWGPEEHWSHGPRFAAHAAALAQRAGVEEHQATRWVGCYGTDADTIAALVAADAGLASPLCPHHPHARAEVVFAVRDELALRLEDWFLRRSGMAFSACHGLDALPAAAEVFSAELGWDAARRAAEIESCSAQLRRTAAVPG